MIFKQIKPEETYQLRLEVLKTSADYIYKYKGDFDDRTIHFAAFDHNAIIGIVTLMEQEHQNFTGRQIQLRGMAVASSHQNKGIGAELIKKGITESKKRNATTLWCNARENAVEFYSKNGFKVKGERFFIEHVCFHYVMYKLL